LCAGGDSHHPAGQQGAQQRIEFSHRCAQILHRSCTDLAQILRRSCTDAPEHEKQETLQSHEQSHV
jgi:hypothetical protein